MVELRSPWMQTRIIKMEGQKSNDQRNSKVYKIKINKSFSISTQSNHNKIELSIRKMLKVFNRRQRTGAVNHQKIRRKVMEEKYSKLLVISRLLITKEGVSNGKSGGKNRENRGQNGNDQITEVRERVWVYAKKLIKPERNDNVNG